MITISSSYDPTSATAGHAATTALAAPCPGHGHIRRQRRRNTQAEQSPRQPRHRDFRRAESSITIELA